MELAGQTTAPSAASPSDVAPRCGEDPPGADSDARRTPDEGMPWMARLSAINAINSAVAAVNR